jgi:hypothetical protein
MNHNKPELPYTVSEQGVHVRHGRYASRSKGRRWLFLVVDILLLAAILAAIFFLVVLLTPLDPFEGRNREDRVVLYTLEITNVDAAALESLSEGDPVVDAKTGSTMGTVVSVDSRAYEFYTDMPTDKPDEHLNSHVVIKDSRTDRYTVTVTVRASAQYREGEGYEVQSCRIAVGRVYELHFPAYAGKGACVTFAEESGVRE